jgi:hypothetical protein
MAVVVAVRAQSPVQTRLQSPHQSTSQLLNMHWTDIASIVFACTAASHLGLIGGIEGIMGKRIPILNCPKCASFWFTLAYAIGEMGFSAIPQIPLVLAISFLSAWSAVWLDLVMGIIDQLYIKIYDTIYSTADNADTDTVDSADSVSGVR